MADMKVYGGGSNPPVRMDPWQNIVNVHWGATGYLAITISAELDITGGAFLPNETVGPDFVEPFTTVYAAAVQVVLDGDGVGSIYIGGPGGWTPAPSGVEIVGLADAEEVGLEEWAWNAVTGIGLRAPFFQWVDDEAEVDEPHIVAPGGALFSQGIAVTAIVKGQQIIAGPFDVPFGAGSIPGKWGTGASTGSPPSAVVTDITTQAFDLSAIVATYLGKTYLPIASVVTEGTTFQTGSLQVLLERQPEEEETPP